VVYDTMVEIDRAAKQRGNVPGGWARLADEALRPQVDWRKELAAQVRQALARAAGQVDYNRDRPSRRTPLVRGLIRPRMVRPIPNVAVVVDTSGSMGDRELGQALSEVQQVLDQVLGGQSAQVLAVDAAVQATRRVWSAKQVRLAGGGGTDMGKGIQAAAQLQPLPDTVIVLTDGFTPWPKDPPPGQRVIVGIIGAERPGRLEPREHSTPEWAAAVGIPVGEPARAHNG
jgi:predicted metal-dependent peptidase